MNFNDQTYFLIEDFLNGKDLKDFQDQIDANSELQEEIELYRLANKAISINRIKEASIISQKHINTLNRSHLIKKTAFLSVIALILLGVFYTIIPANDKTTEEINTDKTVSITSESVFVKSDPINVIEKILVDNHPKKSLSKVDNRDELALIKTNITEELPQNMDEVEQVRTKTEKLYTVEEPSIKSDSSEIGINCNTVHLSAEIEKRGTCKNMSEGSISISNFSGGKAPYHFKVKNSKEEDLDTRHLKGGNYTVSVYDANNCERNYEHILIKEIVCQTEEKSFNPFLGESLDLEEASDNLTFVVYCKEGNIYYSKDFTKGEKMEWNGYSNRGTINSGYYIYYLKGPGGIISQGEVTVTQ